MYVTDCHRRDTAFISCKMQDTTYHRKCPPFFCVNARHNHRRVILTEWCVSFRTRRKWPEAAALKTAGLATRALFIHFIFKSLNSTPYSSTIELLHRHLPCVDSVRQERMEDPGIVLCYAADAVVHAAVGEPGNKAVHLQCRPNGSGSLYPGHASWFGRKLCRGKDDRGRGCVLQNSVST